MSFKVLFDPQAKQDLKEIFLYVVTSDGVSSANKLFDAIEYTCSKLESYPERGHIPPELRSTGIKRYLEIFYKPYRIISEVDNKIVYINTILDGRRNVQEILSERLLR